MHGAFVLSTKSHAMLINVDASPALKMRGVVDVITHKDVPGSNSTGPIIQDEEIFASKQVPPKHSAFKTSLKIALPRLPLKARSSAWLLPRTLQQLRKQLEP